ncbi:MAG: translocation/assembly module TamB domain-containing protein, partial [Rhodothermia bacterium]
EMGEVWNVKQFLIYHDGGQIALDGYVDLDGEQNLILTAEDVETAAFIDLFGIEDVSGALEGYMVLGGTADSLVASAAFRIRDLSTLGEKAGDVQIQMDFADSRLNLEAHVHHVSGHGADITGSVPMNLTLGGEQTVYEADPLDLVLSADSLKLDWTLPFLDRSLISGIAGLLDADLRISGTWEDPELEGSGTVTRGLVALPDFNTELTDVDADFSLGGNVLTINGLNAKTGTGSVSGTGQVDFETLADLGLDLDLQFKDFRAIATETYKFTVSGTAQISGSMRSPVVTADVSVGPGDVYLTEELLADEVESISLTPRDLRTLERRFGYRIASSDTSSTDFVKALSLNARVGIGRDVWLRSSSNPAMDIEFGGDLTVKKDPFSEQRIVGTIDVNPSRSRIIQFARRFGVDRGTITFNGLLEDAVIDFRAKYVVPSRFGGDEVRILLAVTGLMDELELDITSEPQMDDAAIASYLLTGRPPDEATVTGEQAAEIAIGGVSRLVESFANENLGLDVVEIEASGTQGTRLTVGKYISPKTYVFVKQPLTSSESTNDKNGSRGTEIGLEYELYSWLISEISSRRGNFWGNLRWQISY